MSYIIQLFDVSGDTVYICCLAVNDTRTQSENKPVLEFEKGHAVKDVSKYLPTKFETFI